MQFSEFSGWIWQDGAEKIVEFLSIYFIVGGNAKFLKRNAASSGYFGLLKQIAGNLKQVIGALRIHFG